MWVSHLKRRVAVAIAGPFFLLVPYGLTYGEAPVAGRSTDDAAKKIAEVFPLAQGLVVELDNDRVLVDLGARRGAYEGMELEVYREGQEVKHPVTGQLLGRRDVRLGIIRIAEVKEEFSEAVLVSGEKVAKLSWGDSVRVSADRITLALPLINPGDVRGANIHSITKDLAIALTKTGRFMVVEDHLIRASLAPEPGPRAGFLASPANLKALAVQLRVQVLVLGRLTQSEKRTFLDLQVLSTLTGSTLGLVSVQLSGF